MNTHEIDLKPILSAINALQNAGYTAGVEDANTLWVMDPVMAKNGNRVIAYERKLMEPDQVNAFLDSDIKVEKEDVVKDCSITYRDLYAILMESPTAYAKSEELFRAFHINGEMLNQAIKETNGNKKIGS